MTTGDCTHTDLRPLWGCLTGRWKRCACGVNVHLPSRLVYDSATWGLVERGRLP